MHMLKYKTYLHMNRRISNMQSSLYFALEIVKHTFSPHFIVNIILIA